MNPSRDPFAPNPASLPTAYHHCVRVAVDRSHVIGRRDFLRGISARRIGGRRLELDRPDDGPSRSTAETGEGLHSAVDVGRPEPVRDVQPQARSSQWRPDESDRDGGARHPNRREFSEDGSGDERLRRHPLDDEQGGEPSARHLRHAYRLYPQRQREVSQLRRRGRPRNRRSQERSAVVRSRRWAGAGRHQRRIPRRAIRSVRHRQSGQTADQYGSDHRRRSLSPPPVAVGQSRAAISPPRPPRKSAIIESNTPARPK